MANSIRKFIIIYIIINVILLASSDDGDPGDTDDSTVAPESGDADNEDATLSAGEDAIIQGVPCESKNDNVNYFVKLIIDSPFNTNCSGTLINPTTVVTTAHCLEEAKDIQVQIFENYTLKETIAAGENKIIRFEDDLAFLKLETPVTGDRNYPILPTTALSDDIEEYCHEILVVALVEHNGSNDTESSQEENDSNDTESSQEQNGSNDTDSSQGSLVCMYPHILTRVRQGPGISCTPDNKFYSGDLNRWFCTQPDDHKIACGGNSGSGAICTDTGELIGVVTKGNDECEGLNYFSRIDKQISKINPPPQPAAPAPKQSQRRSAGYRIRFELNYVLLLILFKAANVM